MITEQELSICNYRIELVDEMVTQLEEVKRTDIRLLLLLVLVLQLLQKVEGYSRTSEDLSICKLGKY